MTYELTMLQAA